MHPISGNYWVYSLGISFWKRPTILKLLRHLIRVSNKELHETARMPWDQYPNLMCSYDKWASEQDTPSSEFVNTKGVDQPGQQPRRPNNALKFVIHFLKVSYLNMPLAKFQSYFLRNWYKSGMSETQKTSFVTSSPIKSPYSTMITAGMGSIDWRTHRKYPHLH